jgi:hypothetical protein
MEILGIIVVALAFALLIFKALQFSNKTSVVRTLFNTSKQSIRDFEDGDSGKMVGEVSKFESTLTAPIAGRRCIYYRVQVKQALRKRTQHWKTIFDDWEAVAFKVKDDTGTAIVSVDDFEIKLAIDLELHSGLFLDATPELEQYLKEKKYKSTNLLGFNRRLMYNISTVEEGAKVAVLGKGEWNRDEQNTLSVSAGKSPIQISTVANTLN